jgi:hypothetical protein
LITLFYVADDEGIAEWGIWVPPVSASSVVKLQTECCKGWLESPEAISVFGTLHDASPSPLLTEFLWQFQKGWVITLWLRNDKDMY